jgi:hypothetical protein
MSDVTARGTASVAHIVTAKTSKASAACPEALRPGSGTRYTARANKRLRINPFLASVILPPQFNKDTSRDLKLVCFLSVTNYEIKT